MPISSPLITVPTARPRRLGVARWTAKGTNICGDTEKAPTKKLAVPIQAYDRAVAGHTLWGLIAGVILLDAGVQAGHVTNQSRIFALAPEARNRVNTVYMFSFFLGGATGSVLAAYAWQQWTWTGVCAVGFALPMIALVRVSLPAAKQERPNQ